ncbi:uncharacterized protein [Eurosta solidaginis]|uniref:uncharacterized protein n=1 Tax=Eurosta solidaginis TaxID=178769 RepID=UPI003531602B
MEAEGVNVDEYVFYPDVEEPATKVEEKIETPYPLASVDTNAILAVLNQMSSQMTSQLESQETRLTSKMEAQEARISEMSSQISSNMSTQLEEQKTYMASQIAEQLKEQEARITLQLEAQEEHISTKLEAQETKFSTQLGAVSGRQDKVEAEMDALKDRIRELQLNRPITSTFTLKVKFPTFDGSVPFQVFKLQFEKTSAANNWNAVDKVASLFVALKGPAAEILQTIPEYERNSYEVLMAAEERRSGSGHRKQIYQIELQNRYQKANEALQEFASDVEKLAQLANADARVEYSERVKIQNFINGIRDVAMKRVTYADPKQTFAETVSHSLTQEIAALLSKPA